MKPMTQEEREYAKLASKITIAFNYHSTTRLTTNQLKQIYKIIYGTEYTE